MTRTRQPKTWHSGCCPHSRTTGPIRSVTTRPEPVTTDRIRSLGRRYHDLPVRGCEGAMGMAVLIRTSDVPPELRLDAWKSVVCDTLGPLDMRANSDVPLRGEIGAGRL